MRRIIVAQTGPVNSEYRPIYEQKPNNTSINIDLDFINNDNDLFDKSKPNHNYDPITYWHLKNTIKPYFMDDDNSNDNQENQLWVKTVTELTKKEANNSIIFETCIDLQIGDSIEFKRKKPLYCLWLYRRGNDWDSDSNLVNEGKGKIVDIMLNGRKIVVNERRGISNIYCIKYHIIRYSQRRKSNLFKIVINSEMNLIGQFLKQILPAQPWRNVMEIASYLDYKYQKSVYFDYKAFEYAVIDNNNTNNNNNNNKIIELEKECTVCTFLNPLQNEHCSMCDNGSFTNNTHNGNSHWLEQDECYEKHIHELSHIGHPIFPSEKERNKLYSKYPFLPNIPTEQRTYLNEIKHEISMKMKNTTNLFKYQLHSVLWCYMMERAVSTDCKLIIGSNDLRFTNNENIQCNVYSIHNNKFIPSNIANILPQRELTFKGGIIADDVGLGKTLTMLSLIASHPNKNDSLNGMLGSNGKSIRCSATLLVVPARLIEQWKQEIFKHFNEDTFRVVEIMTSNEHKKISYKNILEADIVLIAHEFIDNQYRRNRENEDDHWNNINPLLPPEPIKKQYNLRSKGKQRYQDLCVLSPFLRLIQWKRIILDEAHEIIDYSHTMHVILGLISDYNWYISATPFPNAAAIGFAADFLGIQFDGKFYDEIIWDDNINTPLGYVLHCVFYYNLFSRHTIDSILDDNYLPNIEETAQFVTFHPIEKLFYELAVIRNGNINKLKRRVCSGVYSDFHIEDDDINIDEFNEHYLKYILMENKKNCLSEINTKQTEINDKIANLKALRQRENTLNLKKKEFENEGKLFTLNAAFNHVQTRKKYQHIDMKIKSSEYRLTKLKPILVAYKKEYELIEKYGVFEEIETYEKQFEDEYLLKIVSKYGSKQAMILKYIKQLYVQSEHNHIIIFSSFNDTLQQIKDRLNVIGLDAVVCGGSVYTQRKAIRGFKNFNLGYKQKRARIILLSVQDKASGTDLNCATHVILVDPVPGTCSESFALERQAVGRAVRQGMNSKCTKVVRFVVKDTIEEETYERNMEIRKRLMDTMMKCANVNEVNMKYQLVNCLKVKRMEDQIDFYMNIDVGMEQMDVEGDENVNCLNMGDKKRRMCYDDNEVDGEVIEYQPLNKRRKLDVDK